MPIVTEEELRKQDNSRARAPNSPRSDPTGWTSRFLGKKFTWPSSPQGSLPDAPRPGLLLDRDGGALSDCSQKVARSTEGSGGAASSRNLPLLGSKGAHEAARKNQGPGLQTDLPTLKAISATCPPCSNASEKVCKAAQRGQYTGHSHCRVSDSSKAAPDLGRTAPDGENSCPSGQDRVESEE